MGSSTDYMSRTIPATSIRVHKWVHKASRALLHARVQTNKDQYRQAWGGWVENPTARFGLSLSVNLRHPKKPDFGASLAKGMGMGIVEFTTFSGSTESFVAKIGRRKGNFLAGLVGEGLFLSLNNNLTGILEVNCEAGSTRVNIFLPLRREPPLFLLTDVMLVEAADITVPVPVDLLVSRDLPVSVDGATGGAE